MLFNYWSPVKNSKELLSCLVYFPFPGTYFTRSALRFTVTWTSSSPTAKNIAFAAFRQKKEISYNRKHFSPSIIPIVFMYSLEPFNERPYIKVISTWSVEPKSLASNPASALHWPGDHKQVA